MSFLNSRSDHDQPLPTCSDTNSLFNIPPINPNTIGSVFVGDSRWHLTPSRLSCLSQQYACSAPFGYPKSFSCLRSASVDDSSELVIRLGLTLTCITIPNARDVDNRSSQRLDSFKLRVILKMAIVKLAKSLDRE